MLTGLFRSKKPEPQRVERMEFNTSTQKMGLRFTEKLRDAFRRRWLKIKRKGNRSRHLGQFSSSEGGAWPVSFALIDSYSSTV